MRIYAAVAFLVLVGAPCAALAQNHSADDEAACTPDVMRLCQEFIPNRDAIIACLLQKKREMSPECTKVFSRPMPNLSEGERRRPRRAQQASDQ
jgi:hypothetical protein